MEQLRIHFTVRPVRFVGLLLFRDLDYLEQEQNHQGNHGRYSTCGKSLAKRDPSSRIHSSVVTCVLSLARHWSMILLILLPVVTSQPTAFPTISNQPTRSLGPSSNPTVSIQPSHTPTITIHPSSNPTVSKEPSSGPTVSMHPSGSPTTTVSPSGRPSSAPTDSMLPSSLPSSPFPSQQPSLHPSRSISPSVGPSLRPSTTLEPSSLPTTTTNPSQNPSLLPSLTTSPSQIPSSFPSERPSLRPTVSSVPTRIESQIERRSFRQTFLLSTRELNETGKLLVADLLAGYTLDYRPEEADRVNTTCLITDQDPFGCVTLASSRCNVENSSIPIEDLFLTDLDYECEFSSRAFDVTFYPEALGGYMNGHLEEISQDMQDLDVHVMNIFETRVSQRIVPTLSPTETLSEAPSEAPTTPFPSLRPSTSPTETMQPSSEPTIPSQQPSPSDISSMPSNSPSPPPESSPSGSNAPGNDGGASGGQDDTMIMAVVIAAGGAFLTAIIIWWRRRTRKPPTISESSSDERTNAQPSQEPKRRKRSSVKKNPGSTRKPSPFRAPNNDNNENQQRNIDRGFADLDSPRNLMSSSRVPLVSPSPSDSSNQSLLSTGDSGLEHDSEDETDGRRILQDEFDLYRDQNMEQMRTEVEGNVTGIEGIMSAAVTKALMGEEFPPSDTSEKLFWGNPPDASSIQIEASVLCEIHEWMRRREAVGQSLSKEEKKAFMQNILNRMVTSVRMGAIPADDASRTIHESAAMLSLDLANALPNNTLIVSGMRKKTDKVQLKSTFQKFGHVDDVAIAPGALGFGLIRFVEEESTRKAMQHYGKSDIVIQDVRINVQVLSPESPTEV